MWQPNNLLLNFFLFSFQNLPWAGQEARLVEDYIIYLSDLVSAQTSYLKSCLVMLVKHFHSKSLYLWYIAGAVFSVLRLN